MGKFVYLLTVITVVFCGIKIHQLCQDEPVPVFEEKWWGPGPTKKGKLEVVPFNFTISNELLQDFELRLHNTRPLKPALEGVKQHYGMNSALLEDILNYWKNQYSWREREKFFQKYPHFTTEIQGLNIHFLHIKPNIAKEQNLKVLPMLMLHGWPGSIREFYEIIPMLTTPQPNKDFVFELIVPSLPGFGFSSAASKPGMGSGHVAVIFKNLMERLGFKKFYLQGGDWGGIISANIAALFPDRVLGLHSNFCTLTSPLATAKSALACLFPSLLIGEGVERMCPTFKILFSKIPELGYFFIQATKPDTVGIALDQSPAGMAAFVLEKFTSGTNPEYRDRDDGGLRMKFKYENLLDNLMIYWFSNSMTTAARLYKESISGDQLPMMRVPVIVPTACAKFRYEIMYFPDWILKQKYRSIVQSTVFEEGGHFAALEVPHLLAEDVWSAVEKFEAINKK